MPEERLHVARERTEDIRRGGRRTKRTVEKVEERQMRRNEERWQRRKSKESREKAGDGNTKWPVQTEAHKTRC